MKLLYTIIGLMFLLIGVSAASYTLGTIITQATYNQIDFLNEDLGEKLSKVTFTTDSILFDINYIAYEKQGDGTWKVVNSIVQVPYLFERYSTCRKTGKSIAECKTEISLTVAKQWEYYEADYKQWLDSQKEDDFTGELTPGDFNISFN